MTYQVVTARLIAQTAVHIGSGEGNDLTDALMRRDSKGVPFIPGTAIAGALRSLLTRLAPKLNAGLCAMLEEGRRKKTCNCGVCHLFGDVNPSDEDKAISEASKLFVFNARHIGVLPLPLIRDGVGIDRMTGAAARTGAVKFDMEVLPAGAAFELRMELRDSGLKDEQLLAAGLAEWEAGRLWLGGRVARGFGAFKLSDIQFKTWDLDDSKDLLAFLKENRPWIKAQERQNWLKEKLGTIVISPTINTPDSVARCWFSLKGTLQADGPLLTNDTMASGASGFDHVPLLAEWGNWQNPVLSGAGLRGVLRSHAERLARTMASIEYRNKEAFLLHCPACDPNARDSNKDKQLPLECCDSLLKKKSYSSDKEATVCLACNLFGSTRHGSRLIVEDAPYQQTVDQSKPMFKMLDFLAIDRFTGSGADGFKFDALALWKPAFSLRLFLDNPTTWELGWLWLVIRDLTEGWLTFGFGSAKGFGRVKFTDWKATFGYLSPDDIPLGLAKIDLPERKSGVYTTIDIKATTDPWRELAQDWIKAFHEELKKQRHFDFNRQEDDYFDHLKHLYPIINGGAL
jgi:CRISPR/Cas system CSM-associated protein Csm3 (group 7 of RAMP superfamily)